MLPLPHVRVLPLVHAERQRLLYGIERACSPEYREAIAQDKFGTTDLERLGLEQLRQLLMTLKSRCGSPPTEQVLLRISRKCLFSSILDIETA